MGQLPLIGYAHPLSRKGDPETSKKAGRETGKELPKLHAEILLALRGYFAMNTQPPTSRELGKYMNREAWRRMGELEKRGLVVRGPARRCKVSGKSAATWRLPQVSAKGVKDGR